MLITVFVIRLISARHLDDVTPEIPCDKKLLNKADILYVIPNFNNKSMGENKEWCNMILNLNKTLGLHGIYHTYKEFQIDRNISYLVEGELSFEKCFEFKPERFKPSQLSISKSNKEMIKQKYKLDVLPGVGFHKVYHCNDTGRLPNWLINLI